MMMVMNPLWWLGIHDDGDESIDDDESIME